MAGFKRGDLILTSRPYAYALSNSERGKRCDYCFKVNSALKRCSQCAFCYFCNRECQSKAWETHKEECKSIKKIHPEEPIPSLRLIAQIIRKLKKHGYTKPTEMAGTYERSFADLESHVEDVKKDENTTQRITFFLKILKDFIGEDTTPKRSELTEIYGKMVINTFSIWDAETQSIGCGIYLGASIFDHSCEPNAEVVFEGTTITVRATCDIPDADLRKVYISYIDQMQLSKARRSQLQEQYYFTCECRRCTDPAFDEPMKKYVCSADAAKKIEKSCSEKLELIKDLKRKKEDPSVILDTAMDSLAAQDGVLGDRHIYRIKMMEHVFDACILLKRWTEALCVGRELIEPYQMYYGDFHPNYCVLLTKVGKIELLLHMNDEAEKHLIQAERSTRVSHGIEHPLYLELSKCLLQCQHEIEFGNEL